MISTRSETDLSDLVAQSLRNHRTNVIGILVADLEPFSAELLKGAADAIRGSGFEMVIYSAGGHAGSHVGWERRYLSRLSGTLIDGAVLVTPTVVDVNYGAPIVAIDPHTGQSGLPTIDSDNLRGGQLARGHRAGVVQLGQHGQLQQGHIVRRPLRPEARCRMRYGPSTWASPLRTHMRSSAGCLPSTRFLSSR